MFPEKFEVNSDLVEYDDFAIVNTRIKSRCFCRIVCVCRSQNIKSDRNEHKSRHGDILAEILRLLCFVQSMQFAISCMVVKFTS